MGWDGAVWGRLELPPEQVEAWLAAEARREGLTWDIVATRYLALYERLHSDTGNRTA